MQTALRTTATCFTLVLLAACAQLQGTDNQTPQAATRTPGVDIPDDVRQELSSDLVALQEKIRIPRVSKPLPGPLSRYESFATSTRGGAVLSSPAERAAIVTTVYPGAVMGLSGKKVGEYVEVGYEYYGRLLTGWVDPNVVGLDSGFSPTALTAQEKQALYRKIIDSVNELRAKWQNSPYLSIGSASINVDNTPSVSVNIDYK